MTTYIDTDYIDQTLHDFSLALTQKILQGQSDTFAWTRDSGARLQKDGDEYRVPFVPKLPDNAHAIVYAEARRAFLDVFLKDHDSFLLNKALTCLLKRISFFDVINDCNVYVPEISAKDIDMHDGGGVPFEKDFREMLKNPDFFKPVPMQDLLAMAERSRDKNRKSALARKELRSFLRALRRDIDEKEAESLQKIEQHEIFEHRLYYSQVRRFLYCETTVDDFKGAVRQTLDRMAARMDGDLGRFLVFSEMEKELYRNKRLSEYAQEQFLDQSSLSFLGDGVRAKNDLALEMTNVFAKNTEHFCLSYLFSVDLMLDIFSEAKKLKKDFAGHIDVPEDLPSDIDFFTCKVEMTSSRQYQTNFTQTRMATKDLLGVVGTFAHLFDKTYKQTLLPHDTKEMIERAERVAVNVLLSGRDDVEAAPDFWQERRHPNRNSLFEQHFKKAAPDIFFCVFEEVLTVMRTADELQLDKTQMEKDLTSAFSRAVLGLKSSQQRLYNSGGEHTRQGEWDQKKFQDIIQNTSKDILSVSRVLHEDTLKMTLLKALHPR